MANKIRMFEIEQQAKYLDFDALSHIKKWLDKNDCIYLAVLHDKDENTEPHFHIFVKMNGARSIDDIARQCSIDENRIQHIKKWKNAIAYAFHRTDTARHKYQYSADAVEFCKGVSYDDIVAIDEQYKHNDYIVELLYQYGDCKATKKEIMENISPQDFHKYKRLYDNMKTYRAMKMGVRDMQVIYITGGAGSGKTTLAKYMAYQLKYDYFVSGSGADVLDGYDKEECIILDDLRGDAFTKAELFKLTDNNTNSSVKSRYNNKDISRCKLLIITSVKMPCALYDWKSEEPNEPAAQFARRLNNMLISISNDKEGTVYQSQLNDKLEVIDTQKAGFNMSLVYGILNIVKDNNRAANLLRSIADGVNDAYARKYGGSKQ